MTRTFEITLLPPIPTELEVIQDLARISYYDKIELEVLEIAERLQVSRNATRGYDFYKQVKKLYTKEAA